MKQYLICTAIICLALASSASFAQEEQAATTNRAGGLSQRKCVILVMKSNRVMYTKRRVGRSIRSLDV